MDATLEAALTHELSTAWELHDVRLKHMDGGCKETFIYKVQTSTANNEAYQTTFVLRVYPPDHLQNESLMRCEASFLAHLLSADFPVIKYIYPKDSSEDHWKTITLHQNQVEIICS